MYVELPILITVRVSFERGFTTKDYTGKLVKTLLMQGNKNLVEVFESGSPFPPKPIHVSPLYDLSGGDGKGKKPVYARYIPRCGEMAKPNRNIEPIAIEADKEYLFHVGVSSDLAEEVFKALAEADRLSYGNNTIPVSSLSYETEYTDIARRGEEIEAKLSSSQALKIVFSSPALLKDPLVLAWARRAKKKIMIPLPEAVLSMPLIMLLIDLGRFRQSLYIKMLRYIKTALDTTYSMLGTAKLVWYVYDNKIEPGVIGYIKYKIDRDSTQRIEVLANKKHSISFTETLANTIALAEVYGIGDGRATGFGHTEISF